MNPHKKQSIQSQVLSQSGSQILDLNDLVLGYEGTVLISTLIPTHHPHIHHLRLNGNNIDSNSFSILASSLLHCSGLKSLELQWNCIGLGTEGLQALVQVVANCPQLELIDLKNNRIGYDGVRYLVEIIAMGRKKLRVLDLRWNQIGEIGARAILGVLGGNRYVRFIGLEDNRVSTGTLMEIQVMLKNNSVVGINHQKTLKHSNSLPPILPSAPLISDYPSLETQTLTSELRSKIDLQTKQASRYYDKIETQIQKVLQKIKLRGAQMAQMQLKYDGLLAENGKITAQLRQAQRMLAFEKERVIGIQGRFTEEKSEMRNQKYRLNNNIQNIMEKFTQRNQRQLQQIDLVMNQKLDRLTSFHKQLLHKKRTLRQKQTQLSQQILTFKCTKQQQTNKILLSPSPSPSPSQSISPQHIFSLQQAIASATSTVQNQQKKGQYMSRQLNTLIMRGMSKQKQLQEEIYAVQGKIKDMHHGMAMKNLDMERNLVELRLKQSEIFDKENVIELQGRYLKYMGSQTGVKMQIENMLHDEENKFQQLSEEGIQNRIQEVERALRAQQAQNKMIKNRYQKLMGQLQGVVKRDIQSVLFQ